MRDLMAALTQMAADRMPTLAPVVWFKPTKGFFQYLDRHFPNKPIVDIGAGLGDLSKRLMEHGRKVLAIDPYDREGRVHQVAPFDGMTFKYPAHCLPIMARPCHGVWIGLAIEQAMKTVPAMLYVGLRKNFERDLSGLEDLFRIRTERVKAGQDGELIVRIEAL